MDGFSHLADAGIWLATELTQPTFGLAARIIVAMLLLVAGMYKLRRPLSAAASMVRFGVLPRASRKAGYAFGATEMIVGFALISWTGSLVMLALCGALLLAAGFVAVIALALTRGDRFPCNCLSDNDEEISISTLFRALGMVIALVIAATAIIRDSSIVYPSTGNSLAAVSIAIFVFGMTLTATTGMKLRKRHSAYVKTVDWDWIAASALGQTAPAEGGTQ